MKFEEILKEHGYRVTSKRIKLLSFLSSAKKPLTVSEIRLKMHMDKVTLYRALEDFVSSHLIAKINLHDKAAYYEFIHTNHHHHHIICEICGKLEDIEHCNPILLQKEILKFSKKFKVINSHSLEFFGVCTTCSKI
jgi:Fe2+ or Zn2+ uptake regulation protein